MPETIFSLVVGPLGLAPTSWCEIYIVIQRSCDGCFRKDDLSACLLRIQANQHSYEDITPRKIVLNDGGRDAFIRSGFRAFK